MIEDYAKHAFVWDWDGYDNSPEYDYWCNYAKQYGKKVLIPMCALGESGAYMAERDFQVIAFDITKEMISEGYKRFHSIKYLTFKVADVCNFDFEEKENDFCFITNQDLHLLSDIKMVEQAFTSIAGHLRNGACLALELILPRSESYEYPAQTFYPRIPKYADKKVWKEGKGKYDSISKKHYIDQIVYVQDSKCTDSFQYSIVLQYFDRDEILNSLSHAGFVIKGEYRNRNKDCWSPESHEWNIEAIKI